MGLMVSTVLQVTALVLKALEEALEPLQLTQEQIERQSLEQLQASMKKMDQIIAHPQTLDLTRKGSESPLSVLASVPDKMLETAIMPLLLARKRFLLARMGELQSQHQIGTVRALIARVPDENIKNQLNEQIQQFETDNQHLSQQSKEVEKAQMAVASQEAAEKAKLQTELFERRSKVWQSFLERESVATIVGAFLLVVMAIVLLVAMFVGTKNSEIINNSFLVILGYFFGQATNKAGTNPK